jgi:hypothetical protein
MGLFRPVAGQLDFTQTYRTDPILLCVVCVRWTHEYGALLEKYCKCKTDLLGKKNLSQCYFVQHSLQIDWPGTELGPPRWEFGDWPLTHGRSTWSIKVYSRSCLKRLNPQLPKRASDSQLAAVMTGTCKSRVRWTVAPSVRVSTASISHKLLPLCISLSGGILKCVPQF